MRQYVLVLIGVVALSLVDCRTIEKRDAIDPVENAEDIDNVYRDRRAVDGKFGVKNAILGFVFNKINSFIDQKTAWIDQLDKTNIEKNRIHGIEPPKDPVTSLSAAISGAIGEKLQAAGPILSVVTSKLSSGSSSGIHKGFNLGSILGGISGGGVQATASAHANI